MSTRLATRTPALAEASPLADAIARLQRDLQEVRARPALAPRTAKLLSEGVPKMAKKVGEEAVELALDAVGGDRRAIVAEAADLVYHLIVLLDALGIDSAEVAEEMDRRRGLLGIAEKLPKPGGR